MSRLILLAPLALAACIADPNASESPVIPVDTPAGQVTCQLYTARIVLYDHAVTRPQGMTDAVANQYCRDEGLRRQAELLAARE